MSDLHEPGRPTGRECFAGNGAMAARMQTFDWSKTPVGPVESWPQSLRTAVCIMLTSRYAMWMAWGPDLSIFYNDAYAPTLGIKQTWALGSAASTVWAEIWTDIGPRIESVLKTGEATWDLGLRLYLERSGYPEETYHTFSYSPLADDVGIVCGMFCVVTEETDRVIGERRLKTFRDLLKKELLDAAHVLEQAVESVRPLIDDRKHELITVFERGEMPIWADPTRIEQIVVNLLTNAAKYTESGGRIALSGAVEAGSVVIKVKDNGIGIPPEKLPDMFQLFSQGERSIARSEGGLGIGLTIVRKLTEMHGGRVTAFSEGSDKGSEFVVSLPVAEPPRTKVPPPAAVPGEIKKGARILAVDDKVDTAEGMARLLKLLGNEVQIALNGKVAIETAKTFRPDFVLLDIGLPGMDGYEVAATLRKDPAHKNTVIVAVSGYGQDDDRRRARDAGFDHHLVKPVDFATLTTLLRGE
jgi:CheY-like chemotaxis protein/two-component sensor histidine kinase